MSVDVIAAELLKFLFAEGSELFKFIFAMAGIYLAARVAYGKYLSEKTWDRRQGVYSQIMADLHTIKTHWERCSEEDFHYGPRTPEYQRQVDAFYEESWAAFENLKKIIGCNIFVLSPGFYQVAHRLVNKIERCCTGFDGMEDVCRLDDGRMAELAALYGKSASNIAVDIDHLHSLAAKALGIAPPWWGVIFRKVKLSVQSKRDGKRD